MAATVVAGTEISLSETAPNDPDELGSAKYSPEVGAAVNLSQTYSCTLGAHTHARRLGTILVPGPSLLLPRFLIPAKTYGSGINIWLYHFIVPNSTELQYIFYCLGFITFAAQAAITGTASTFDIIFYRKKKAEANFKFVGGWRFPQNAGTNIVYATSTVAAWAPIYLYQGDRLAISIASGYPALPGTTIFPDTLAPDVR